ncbi:unnamed protein product [Echinostoma caproni]|uniref:T-box domain-containing protein n=1 Tax=Echinostoma caproni TaxID=27848 RepID=A0A183AQ75_9TREM|nr:unnamed protein product [Echinostoma caproni]
MNDGPRPTLTQHPFSFPIGDRSESVSLFAPVSFPFSSPLDLRGPGRTVSFCNPENDSVDTQTINSPPIINNNISTDRSAVWCHSSRGGGRGSKSDQDIVEDATMVVMPTHYVSRGCGAQQLAAVRCHLETRDLWEKFNELGTEMIITKSGRKQWSPIKMIALYYLWVTFLMDIVPVDCKRYRYAYHRSSWLVAGKADPELHLRHYVHPDSPFTGEQLIKQTVSFEKLKLTNNVLDRHGYIILNSMHKYQPRVHLVRRSAVDALTTLPSKSLDSLRPDEIKTFEFAETVFIAVTAYQNQLVSDSVHKYFKYSSNQPRTISRDYLKRNQTRLMKSMYVDCEKFISLGGIRTHAWMRLTL